MLDNPQIWKSCFNENWDKKLTLRVSKYDSQPTPTLVRHWIVCKLEFFDASNKVSEQSEKRCGENLKDIFQRESV